MTASTIRSRRGLRSFTLHAPLVQRVTGAVVGFVIAGIVALLGANWAQAPFLVAGIPSATTAGFIVGPAIRVDRTIVRGAITMSILTLLLSDAFVVLQWVGMALEIVDRPAAAIIVVAELIGLWMTGLILVGVPVYVVLVGPCGVAWAAILYSLAARQKMPSA